MANQHCVIGKHGLIGSALARRLGDVSSFPTPDTRVIFDFGSYVHPEFEREPHYQIQQALNRFTNLLPLCVERGILYVYASSALVYEKDRPFSLFKKTLEQLAACYDARTMGLRIFPVYGPGDHGTVISKWCQQMQAGERPVIYGDGEQSRDFIFIDDVVEQILSLVLQYDCQHRIADVGAGRLTTFNEIVAMINRELGTSFAARYVERPAGYPEGIRCPNPPPTKVSIEEGIRRILGPFSKDYAVSEMYARPH